MLHIELECFNPETRTYHDTLLSLPSGGVFALGSLVHTMELEALTYDCKLVKFTLEDSETLLRMTYDTTENAYTTWIVNPFRSFDVVPRT